jgi:hypothetical protein
MATITSESISATAHDAGRYFGVQTRFKQFWQQFFIRAFDPYRPELHYMRGPGPACRAKQSDLPHQPSS